MQPFRMDDGEGAAWHSDDEITLTNTQAESLFARVKSDLHVLQHNARTATSRAGCTSSPTLSPQPLKEDFSVASAQVTSDPAGPFHRGSEPAAQPVVVKQKEEHVAEHCKSPSSDTLIDLTRDPDDASSELDGKENEDVLEVISEPSFNAVGTLKRTRSVDHERDELPIKTLSQLRGEPFEPMHRLWAGQNIVDDCNQENGLLIHLPIYLPLRAESKVESTKGEFFACLNLEAYSASGPFISRKLSEITQELVEVRKRKRQCYQSFESELQAQDDLLDGNDGAVHKLLASLKAAGGSLIKEQAQNQMPFEQAPTDSTPGRPRTEEI